jgi:predicted deacylase
MMIRSAAFLGLILLVSACATISPRVRIEKRLQELGLTHARAECLSSELDNRLDRHDLEAVADFVGDLHEATSAGETLDALLSIDNPRAASAIARAGLSCAFGN